MSFFCPTKLHYVSYQSISFQSEIFVIFDIMLGTEISLTSLTEKIEKYNLPSQDFQFYKFAFKVYGIIKC